MFTVTDTVANFSAQPITIAITKIHAGQVRIGVAADPRFRILREELTAGSAVAKAKKR